jgi:hypothetical protein
MMIVRMFLNLYSTQYVDLDVDVGVGVLAVTTAEQFVLPICPCFSWSTALCQGLPGTESAN